MRDKIIFTVAKVLVLLLLVAVSCATTYAITINRCQYYTVTLIGRYDTYTVKNIKEDSYYSPAPELRQSQDENYVSHSIYFKGWYKDAAYEHPWLSGEDKVNCDICLYAQWEWD